MPLKRFTLLGFIFLTLIIATGASSGIGSGSSRISGVVTDQQKKPLSGVMITAFDSVEDKMITVFTKEGGRFKLPELTGRDYKLRARLLGFEDELKTIPYKSVAAMT